MSKVKLIYDADCPNVDDARANLRRPFWLTAATSRGTSQARAFGAAECMGRLPAGRRECRPWR